MDNENIASMKMIEISLHSILLLIRCVCGLVVDGKNSKQLIDFEICVILHVHVNPMMNV